MTAMLSKLLPNNEHVIERVVRVAVGIVGLSLIFVGPQTLWGVLGVVPLLTGLLGSCPVYTLFGFSTCPMKSPTGKGPASGGAKV